MLIKNYTFNGIEKNPQPITESEDRRSILSIIYFSFSNGLGIDTISFLPPLPYLYGRRKGLIVYAFTFGMTPKTNEVIRNGQITSSLSQNEQQWGKLIIERLLQASEGKSILTLDDTGIMEINRLVIQYTEYNTIRTYKVASDKKINNPSVQYWIGGLLLFTVLFYNGSNIRYTALSVIHMSNQVKHFSLSSLPSLLYS